MLSVKLPYGETLELGKETFPGVMTKPCESGAARA